jgi:hypothetical protein
MTLVSPKLLGRLKAFYPTVGQVEENTPAANDHGDQVASWSTLVGHEAIRCRISPLRNRMEIRQPTKTYVPATHRIALAGHYPEITEQMRFVAGETTYAILLVSHDGQSHTTVLDAEVVR